MGKNKMREKKRGTAAGAALLTLASLIAVPSYVKAEETATQNSALGETSATATLTEGMGLRVFQRGIQPYNFMPTASLFGREELSVSPLVSPWAGQPAYLGADLELKIEGWLKPYLRAEGIFYPSAFPFYGFLGREEPGFGGGVGLRGSLYQGKGLEIKADSNCGYNPGLGPNCRVGLLFIF